jgi:hypothetical protein
MNKLSSAASVLENFSDEFELERRRPNLPALGAIRRSFEDVGLAFFAQRRRAYARRRVCRRMISAALATAAPRNPIILDRQRDEFVGAVAVHQQQDVALSRGLLQLSRGLWRRRHRLLINRYDHISGL